MRAATELGKTATSGTKRSLYPHVVQHLPQRELSQASVTNKTRGRSAASVLDPTRDRSSNETELIRGSITDTRTTVDAEKDLAGDGTADVGADEEAGGVCDVFGGAPADQGGSRGRHAFLPRGRMPKSPQAVLIQPGARALTRGRSGRRLSGRRRRCG